VTPVITTVDIETRPNEVYTWGLFDQNVGLNQIIRPGGVLMIAAQEVGRKKVDYRADWDGYEDMVKWSWDVYDRSDYVVTYNGARFDNKHLRAAWAELGLTPPAPWRDLDLLTTVRQFQWPSRKLEFVCQKLGVSHKTDPGGFRTWTAILQGEGKARDDARKRMVKYCVNDVRITTELFHRLRPWVSGLNIPLVSGVDEDVKLCTRCGSDNVQSRGWAYTTTTRYRRFQCRSCGGWMRSRKSDSLKTVLVS
jgi:hypothetical protein